MSDTVDIDALVVKARATARELNELLTALRKAKVWVSIWRPQILGGPGPADMPRTCKVELCFGFPAEDEDGW